MAYELVAEVLDHAPPDLTPAEVLVLAAVAEYVLNEDYKRGSRRTSRPAADIARRAHMTLDGLRKALQRLAKNDLEIRVPLATGKDGRPVYAVPGKSGTYEVPTLAAPPDCLCNTCKKGELVTQVVHKAVPQSRLNGEKAVPQSRLGGTTVQPGGTGVPPGGTGVLPNRVSVPGNQGPRARTRAGARARANEPTTEDLDTIIEEMNDHAGIVVSRDHARRIYQDVISRAGAKIGHPLRYVLAAIRDEPHRYRPTPTPPPMEPARQLPLVAVASDETRAKVMSQLRAGTA